jgi:hypothetical protein
VSKKKDGKIYNLLDCFKSPLSRPLAASYLPSDMVRKLITCNLNIAFFLDVDAWIEQANQLPGVRMFLETSTNTRKAQEAAKGYELATYRGQLICMELPGGKFHLGQGSLDRILFDFQTPISLALSSLHSNIGKADGA